MTPRIILLIIYATAYSATALTTLYALPNTEIAGALDIVVVIVASVISSLIMHRRITRADFRSGIRFGAIESPQLS